MTPYSCPKCKADLTGKKIPEKSRHLFGNATHFSKVIGEIRNDRHWSWHCPFCNHEWKYS